jgi:saccharopine dehydrogenase-like NADP-dependent oxidoreductase
LDNRPPPLKKGTALDLLVSILLEKMQYQEGEKDMIVLHHEFIAQYKFGPKKITSTLVDFGTPFGESAKSRAVGLPAPIAARLILEGKIKVSGVCLPVQPTIYKPVLAELAKHGLKFREERIYL